MGLEGATGRRAQGPDGDGHFLTASLLRRRGAGEVRRVLGEGGGCWVCGQRREQAAGTSTRLQPGREHPSLTEASP